MLHVIFAVIITYVIILHGSCKYDMNPLCLSFIMFFVFAWLFMWILMEGIKRDGTKNAKNDEDNENE